MVEIRHCDRCGNRLPVDLVPGTGAACPKCGHVVEEPGPVGAASGGAARPRTTPHPRPRTVAHRAPVREAPLSERGKRAQGPSNTLTFAVAAVVGVLVAVAAALLVMGGRRHAEGVPAASTDTPPAGPARPSSGGEAAAGPYLGSALASSALTEASAPDAGAEGVPAPVPPPEPAAGPGGGDDGDDFFAKLRAQSEERRERLAKVHEGRLRDPPPLPDVYASDLAPRVATCGWGDNPKMNRSIENNPLKVCGKEYAKGIGTHSCSEITFALEPGYRRFVASAGIDDEKGAMGLGTVTFEVYADDKILWLSDVVRGGQLWHMDIFIPPGSRELRLLVTEAGDDTFNDHADWLNAGFVTRSE